jgi:predicted SAM-dependent methyltransferase
MKGFKKDIIMISKVSLYSIYARYKGASQLKKRNKKQQNIINTYISSENIKRLQIGCGSNLLNSWLNTDLKDIKEDIAFMDAGEKFPLTSNSFDFIYSEHVFEHLDLSQQINMMQESYRILKIGGVLRIATPSLDFLFNLYKNPEGVANKAYTNWAINHSNSLVNIKNQVKSEETHYCYVINNFFRAWGHQLIHNFDSLKHLGQQYGFQIVESCEVGESKYAELQNIEKHGTIIPDEFNKKETMVIEFTK